MKTSRTWLKPAARSVLLAVLAAGWMLMPVRAADTMQSTMVSISGAVAALTLTTSGAERVVFSGQAQIKSRLALDPDFGDSKLLLFIDMTGVAGVGSSSGATYLVPTQEILIRPLALSHQVEITFPFFKNAADSLASTRTGLANFALNVDVSTGAITSASATAVSR